MSCHWVCIKLLLLLDYLRLREMQMIKMHFAKCTFLEIIRCVKEKPRLSTRWLYISILPKQHILFTNVYEKMWINCRNNILYKNRIKNTIHLGLEILTLIKFVFTDLWYPIWNVHLIQCASCHQFNSLYLKIKSICICPSNIPGRIGMPLNHFTISLPNDCYSSFEQHSS